MNFKLPKLNYSYESLEPYIDSLTMKIHHTKHHATYTENLNKAIKDFNIENKNIENILKENVDKISIRNNGGGFYNHNLFWNILNPENRGEPSIKLKKAIDICFNSFKSFQNEFTKISINRFGSGWAWLCIKNGKLILGSTANQDNPLMPNINIEGYPILCLDLWEHAYYLKYQNRRLEYIDAFWKIINWRKVSEYYNNAINAII